MSDKVIKVGLMGLGTVGTGVYKVMENQRSEFPYKIGTNMEITKILVRENAIEDAKSRVRSDIQVVGNYEDIVNDPEIDIVVEVMGGIDFADIIVQVGEAKLEVGLFVQAVINFFITAFVLFLVVKFFNSFKKKEEAKPAPPPAVPEDVKLLKEIRDLLKNK